MKDIGEDKYISHPHTSLKTLDDYPGIWLSINQKSGSNPIQVVKDIENTINDFKEVAPLGIRIMQYDNKKDFI